MVIIPIMWNIFAVDSITTWSIIDKKPPVGNPTDGKFLCSKDFLDDRKLSFSGINMVPRPCPPRFEGDVILQCKMTGGVS